MNTHRTTGELTSQQPLQEIRLNQLIQPQPQNHNGKFFQPQRAFQPLDLEHQLLSTENPFEQLFSNNNTTNVSGRFKEYMNVLANSVQDFSPDELHGFLQHLMLICYLQLNESHLHNLDVVDALQDTLYITPEITNLLNKTTKLLGGHRLSDKTLRILSFAHKIIVIFAIINTLISIVLLIFSCSKDQDAVTSSNNVLWIICSLLFDFFIFACYLILKKCTDWRRHKLIDTGRNSEYFNECINGLIKYAIEYDKLLIDSTQLKHYFQENGIHGEGFEGIKFINEYKKLLTNVNKNKSII